MQNNAKVIANLLKAFEVGTAADLAEKLEVGQSTVSTWRTRGVPSRMLLKAAKLTGRSVEWFYGEEIETETETPQVPEHARRLFEEIYRVILREDRPIDRQYEISAKVLKLLSDEDKKQD